jgi:alpha-beta hydrolase superfamily lysophospholipase
LDAFAERFARAGFAVFVFDYRHFGDSEGKPRQLLDISRQQEDWRAAVETARHIPEIDPNRIAVWGTSFSAGHVLCLCSQDDSIAAAVAQVPFVDGPATARMTRLGDILRLAYHAVLDAARGWLGLSPHYIAAVGLPGEAAAIAIPEAKQVEANLVPPGVVWKNEVAARILLSLLRYRPARAVGKIRFPVLYCLAVNDNVTPYPTAATAASHTPRAEVRRYPLSHFDIYVGDPFEQAVSDQIEFLNRHVGRKPDFHE